MEDRKNDKSSLDNGNYIIKSKINTSYALTTTGAKTTDGANVMLYTYSIHNNCNDEWIFVKCSGYALRSVNIAVQQDQTYLTRYNDQRNEVNKTITDAAKPFYTKWHIEFRPSYYTLSSMKLDDCPNGSNSQCTSTNCGSTCKNRISAPNHHKNFDYNALNAWKAYGMDGNDMRLVLVGVQLCHEENGSHKNNGLGWWPSGKNGMVLQNRTHMLNVRVIQHELSHTYGVSHCTSSKCIMNGGFDKNYVYNLDNIWCSSCAKQFDRTEY